MLYCFACLFYVVNKLFASLHACWVVMPGTSKIHNYPVSGTCISESTAVFKVQWNKIITVKAFSLAGSWKSYQYKYFRYFGVWGGCQVGLEGVSAGPWWSACICRKWLHSKDSGLQKQFFDCTQRTVACKNSFPACNPDLFWLFSEFEWSYVPVAPILEQHLYSFDSVQLIHEVWLVILWCVGCWWNKGPCTQIGFLL